MRSPPFGFDAPEDSTGFLSWQTTNLYLVGGDTLILAPKKPDLMFIGGGIWDSGYTPDEESLFYKGYG